ncbi:Protein NRT1/ PTR FAMILY 6.2 [Bienertia sinuspersici]
MCERLSTMGIAVNLVTYLVGTMHLPSSTSANCQQNYPSFSHHLVAQTRMYHAKEQLNFKWDIVPSLVLDRPRDRWSKVECIRLGVINSMRQMRKNKLKEPRFLAGIDTRRVWVALLFISSKLYQLLVKKTKLQLPYDVSMLYEDTPDDKRVSHTEQLAIVAEGDFVNVHGEPNPWKLCSVTKVEEVKMMARLLPVWGNNHNILDNICSNDHIFSRTSFHHGQVIRELSNSCWITYCLLCGCHFNQFSCHDRVVVPLWKSWRGKPGLTLSTLGMAAAALAEMKRLSIAKAVGRDSQSLPISVYFLIPQFFLVGAGEAFIYTGQLDFFITQSPKSMKTMSTGLFLTLFLLDSSLVASWCLSSKVLLEMAQRRMACDDINYGDLITSIGC